MRAALEYLDLSIEQLPREAACCHGKICTGQPGGATVCRSSSLTAQPCSKRQPFVTVGSHSFRETVRWFGVFFYLFSGVEKTKLSWLKISFVLDSKKIQLTTYGLLPLFLCFIRTCLANWLWCKTDLFYDSRKWNDRKYAFVFSLLLSWEKKYFIMASHQLPPIISSAKAAGGQLLVHYFYIFVCKICCCRWFAVRCWMSLTFKFAASRTSLLKASILFSFPLFLFTLCLWTLKFQEPAEVAHQHVSC